LFCFVFFVSNIENKDDVVCCGFLLDRKILYLESKHTFKESEMVRNTHQEDSTNGKEGDNDLEAIVSFFGLQEGLNQRPSKPKPRYRTLWTRSK